MIAFQGKSFFAPVVAAAVFALAFPALAATPVINFDNAPTAPTVTPTPDSNPETRLNQNWIFNDGDYLTSFLADHKTSDAAAPSTSETSRGMKLLLAFSGLAILTRRRKWWRKASVI